MGASAGAKHTRHPAVRLVSICVFPLGWVLFCFLDHLVGLPGGAVLKNPLAAAGDVGSIPGLKRSPAGGNGNRLQHSCLVIPWTEEPGGLQSVGSQRVRHD